MRKKGRFELYICVIDINLQQRNQHDVRTMQAVFCLNSKMGVKSAVYNT